MVVSEHRLKRMIRIVDMMRKQQYPNYTKIRRAFEQATFDTTETMVLTCDRKTIWQDLKILKEEFHCPWEYDRSRHGYYLKDIHWDFAYPAYLSESQMMAMLVGRRISENIFPEPLKSDICSAVDYLLNVANPDLQKCSFVSQMKFFSPGQAMLILRFLNQFTRHGGIIFFCILYIAIIKETPRCETLNLMRFFSVITTGISTRAHVMQMNHEIL